MQALIIVLLVVLIAAVVYFGLQANSNKTEVIPPAPLDTDAIARTVQTAINLEAISTSVQGAVAAQMLKTAQEALVANNAQASQQATQTLSGQTAALDTALVPRVNPDRPRKTFEHGNGRMRIRPFLVNQSNH